MKVKLSDFSTSEKVVLFAIFLNHFSYWPTISVGGGDSGLEFAMLSGVTIFAYTVKKYGSKLYNSFIESRFAWFIAAWFIYGVATTLLTTSELGINLLRSLYLESMLLASYSVYFLMKHKKIQLKNILKGWTAIALLLAPIVGFQFVLAATGSADLIRETYNVGVFSFPRAHGFAFEPLFFANWLLVPVMYSFYLVSKKPIRLNLLVLTALSSIFFLTLSRGAFMALVIGLVLFTFQNRHKITLMFKPVYGLTAGFVIAMVLVGASSSLNDTPFKNGVGRYLDHATFGVFNNEGANNVQPKQVETKTTNVETFVSLTGIDDEGVVEGSTKGRQEANSTAIDLFNRDTRTRLLGIGLFRFGEEANLEAPEIYSSTKQLSNNQWLDVLVETGILGVLLLSSFAWSARKSLLSAHPLTKVFVVMMLVQFISFSGYFLIPFWVCLALLLGSKHNEVIV